MVASRRNTHSSRDAGASLIEYALLVALIAVAAIVAVRLFGGSVGGSLSRSGSELFPVILPLWLPTLG